MTLQCSIVYVHTVHSRFQRPRVEQIKASMMSVCFKEKVPIKADALNELIIGCGQDVRQVSSKHSENVLKFLFSILNNIAGVAPSVHDKSW